MNFRIPIKNICKAKGITQKELAAMLGITSVGLNQMLRGEYPQLQSLEKIAKCLDVEILDLFPHPDHPQSITCPHCGKKIIPY